MGKKLISIIILSWNRKDEIAKTLGSLQFQTFKDFEILVVDQNSDDGAPEMINELFPEVKLIELHKNFGVPGGRNVGAKNANGEILFFLDNDAHIDPNALELVWQKFSQNLNVGIIGFKIVNAESKKLDYLSWVYQKSKIQDIEKEFYTYTFCGAGHAIKKEVFDKVGYYWDELFFSWEEMEFSIRVLDAGYSILYDPDIIVYHRISNEKRTNSSLHECRRLRNSLWVLWRYFPLGFAVKESFVRVLAYFIKAIRKRCFSQMMIYFINSFSKFGMLFNNKYRISKETLKKYKKLSNKGTISQQIRHLF